MEPLDSRHRNRSLGHRWKSTSIIDIWMVVVVVTVSICTVQVANGRNLRDDKNLVRVRVYDHRAEHDPVQDYGRGPWRYFGHGHGYEYGYKPDQSYEFQRGYGFVKAWGREFCKPGVKYCRPPDPNFHKRIRGLGAEPYWGHPPDVTKEDVRSPEEPNAGVRHLPMPIIHYARDYDRPPLRHPDEEPEVDFVPD